MEKHKMAGLPVKITSGPFKDKYFIVIDFMVNQYQGKTIEKIYKSHPALLHPVKQRMKKLDDQIVFGKLHPSMEFCCMHDTELQAPKAPTLSDIEKEDAEAESNVVDIKQGAKNVTRGPSTSDSESTEPGGPESEGRSIPSAEATTDIERPTEVKSQADSEAGSPSRGSKERPTRRKK